MKIENQQVIDDLTAQFPGEITGYEAPYGMLTATVVADALISAVTYLQGHSELKIGFLTDITAVHYPDRVGEELCIVYHLHSLQNNFRIRLKVYVPIAQPEVPTLCHIYASANWMERETYDFFGVQFTNHPNLIRILNLDDMDYFPMRKEYPLEDPTRRDKVDAMFGR